MLWLLLNNYYIIETYLNQLNFLTQPYIFEYVIFVKYTTYNTIKVTSNILLN